MLEAKPIHPSNEWGTFLLTVSDVCLLFQPTHLHKASDCQSQVQDTFVSMDMSHGHDTTRQCGYWMNSPKLKGWCTVYVCHHPQLTWHFCGPVIGIWHINHVSQKCSPASTLRKPPDAHIFCPFVSIVCDIKVWVSVRVAPLFVCLTIMSIVTSDNSHFLY